MVYPFGTGQCLTTLTPCARSRYILVSIPLEQGNVLRQKDALYFSALYDVSIPLEQGNVLRQKCLYQRIKSNVCLNPFGTGQCLTTLGFKMKDGSFASQSLWNRAMSYDIR